MGWINRFESYYGAGPPPGLLHDPTIADLVNPSPYGYGPAGPLKFERLVGVGVHSEFSGDSPEAIQSLRRWLSEAGDFVFGHFCYDTKNILENLDTSSPQRIAFPMFRFFIPQHVAILSDAKWVMYSHGTPAFKGSGKKPVRHVGHVQSGRSESEYISDILRIKRDIQSGEFYEANYCVEHWAEGCHIDVPTFFDEMTAALQAPFSCRLSMDGKHLISASPERFMMKTGDRVISQPMKGTNRRAAENTAAIHSLMNDPKERAENIMITDLVRNDLSKFARKGTVKVDHLCDVHAFAHVNQMISTVSCDAREDVHPLDILLSAFPMGSMTGAPKVRTMQLMDRYEGFARGLFSGSIGYFTPDLDFDFNVVIRSVLFDEHTHFLSFPTGSAITINSEPEQEWRECQLKAESLRSLLAAHASRSD